MNNGRHSCNDRRLIGMQVQNVAW